MSDGADVVIFWQGSPDTGTSNWEDPDADCWLLIESLKGGTSRLLEALAESAVFVDRADPQPVSYTHDTRSRNLYTSTCTRNLHVWQVNLRKFFISCRGFWRWIEFNSIQRHKNVHELCITIWHKKLAPVLLQVSWGCHNIIHTCRKFNYLITLIQTLVNIFAADSMVLSSFIFLQCTSQKNKLRIGRSRSSKVDNFGTYIKSAYATSY